MNNKINYSPTHTLIVGEQTYQIIKKIGNGSSSIVYMGRSTFDNKIVAIKMINRTKLSIQSLQMLENELSIMRQLINIRHENIIGCYEVIDFDDDVFIVMEYCENGNLDELIGNRLEMNQIKKYILQIVNGLIYLKDNKIIHNDIKPSNILITNNFNQLKICDFGLSNQNDTHYAIH